MRRFRTLYKVPPTATLQYNLKLDPQLFASLGINPAAAKAESASIEAFFGEQFGNVLMNNTEGAALLAGLYESGTNNTPTDFTNNAAAKDRQWWVTFKRQYYGTDEVYDKPFIGPRKLSGTSAPVVHDGTLAQAGFTPAGVKQIDAVCQEWATKGEEGLGVCIVRHGVIVLQKAYGSRNGQPMTLTTKSGMASITKAMAGTIMMETIDQGLVKLDDPIDKYLPALRGIEVKQPITVRHLYTHTAGLSGHWGDEMNDLEEVLADLYPYLEVGQRHEYNGAGYALGSKIVETVSGEALPQFYQKHLLAPLGCTNTVITDSAGGMRSTPLDMAKVGQLLLNGGVYGDQLFFSNTTFQQMLPEKLTKVLGPDTSTVWGIGITPMDWLAKEGLSNQAFGHGAASSAIFAVDPGTDMVVVVTREKFPMDYGGYVGKFFHAIAEAMAK